MTTAVSTLRNERLLDTPDSDLDERESEELGRCRRVFIDICINLDDAQAIEVSPLFRLLVEQLTAITKSTYAFVQQLITIKLLDLDSDEYERNTHRYRTRVDANAAALELLCLTCNDESGTSPDSLSLTAVFTRRKTHTHSQINLSIFLDAEKHHENLLSTYAAIDCLLGRETDRVVQSSHVIHPFMLL